MVEIGGPEKAVVIGIKLVYVPRGYWYCLIACALITCACYLGPGIEILVDC